MHHSIRPTRSSQDKENETSDFFFIIAMREHQMDTIDLKDESKDAKILTPWLFV
jgi:hypothetical protein